LKENEMKILITGGLGVIGSYFAKMMSSHPITIIDSAEEERNHLIKSFLPSHINVRLEKLETADLSDLSDYDLVLHAAAHTGIPHSIIDPHRDWTDNVDATKHLLDALRITKKPPKMVVLSSVKPYQTDNNCQIIEDRYVWNNRCVGFDETTELEPDEPYAASKMAQSALCMAYARSYNLPITVFRCSNLYGPAPCHGPRHGWLTWFCVAAVLGRPLEIQGNGCQVRDMLFASDVGTAVLSAYDQMKNCQGKVYNVGGGIENSVSVKEAATMIQEIIPNTQLIYRLGRSHEDLIFITDYSRFHHITFWKPQINVKTGISQIIEWALENKQYLQEAYAGV
jgi:CDP-paratose 2-epimerase